MKLAVKILLASVAGAMLTFGIAGVSSAVSPAQEECEAAGGTYTFSKGTATCIVEEPFNPGNPQSDNSNQPFTEEMEEDQKGQGGGQGEDTNKHHTEEEENTNPSGNAPPGQN